MVDTNKLQGIMKEQKLSATQVANAIGIEPSTFYRRIKAQMFKSNEIEGLINVLGITDPMPIFFKH